MIELSVLSHNNQTVMFSPAAGFYANMELGKKQIRIAFILNSEDIRAAIECLGVGLKVYQDTFLNKFNKRITK